MWISVASRRVGDRISVLSQFERFLGGVALIGLYVRFCLIWVFLMSIEVIGFESHNLLFFIVIFSPMFFVKEFWYRVRGLVWLLLCG